MAALAEGAAVAFVLFVPADATLNPVSKAATAVRPATTTIARRFTCITSFLSLEG
jgi:hypothetical protein